MHECTFLFTVIACIVHHGRHAVPAQGVRVQNSTKNGARVHLNGANLLPSLSVFEKPRPHFVAELIRFDRMERGRQRRGCSSTTGTFGAILDNPYRPDIIVSGWPRAHIVWNKDSFNICQ